MQLTPNSRPQMDAAAVRAELASYGVDTTKPALLGIRGYYAKTMGPTPQNDRGVYDDAIFLLTPNGFQAFNANVDPSVYRPGIATLVPGVWQYKVGIHGLSKPAKQQYTALVQAGQVTVLRDGQSFDRGWFGINIHRGGQNGTSSLGCQTIVPDQWEQFIASVRGELKRAGQTVIPYCLTAHANTAPNPA